MTRPLSCFRHVGKAGCAPRCPGMSIRKALCPPSLSGGVHGGPRSPRLHAGLDLLGAQALILLHPSRYHGGGVRQYLGRGLESSQDCPVVVRLYLERLGGPVDPGPQDPGVDEVEGVVRGPPSGPAAPFARPPGQRPRSAPSSRRGYPRSWRLLDLKLWASGTPERLLEWLILLPRECPNGGSFRAPKPSTLLSGLEATGREP
jgi:hypothetical protein